MGCHYLDSCPFPTDKLAAMPFTTSFMVDNYCHWDFTKCVIYKTAKDHGIQDVSHETDSECCLSDKVLNLLIFGKLSG